MRIVVTRYAYFVNVKIFFKRFFYRRVAETQSFLKGRGAPLPIFNHEIRKKHEKRKDCSAPRCLSAEGVRLEDNPDPVEVFFIFCWGLSGSSHDSLPFRKKACFACAGNSIF